MTEKSRFVFQEILTNRVEGYNKGSIILVQKSNGVVEEMHISTYADHNGRFKNKWRKLEPKEVLELDEKGVTVTNTAFKLAQEALKGKQ